MLCILPLAPSPDLFSPDEMIRTGTFCFGLATTYSPIGDPNGGILSDIINRRGQQPGAICARSGNYFPGEHLTTDGQGRKVGRQFRTDGPAIIPDTPFPTFIVSPPYEEID
jgi:hypothetical protein